MEYVAVTGSCGMLGCAVVSALLKANLPVIGIDIKAASFEAENYIHIKMSLENDVALYDVLSQYKVSHVIHLAALAHTIGENDLSFERYRFVNVQCSQNVFETAKRLDANVLFASTADVYGMTDGIVDINYPRKPIGNYAVSKRTAEDLLEQLGCSYTIFRFAPVYTAEIKRDIQKRYYLKAPEIAYRIGKGQQYEVCGIENAVMNVVEWVKGNKNEKIYNIYDEQRLDTADVLKKEKAAGRAKTVVVVPKFAVKAVFYILKKLMPDKYLTFLLCKAINPIRFR